MPKCPLGVPSDPQCPQDHSLMPRPPRARAGPWTPIPALRPERRRKNLQPTTTVAWPANTGKASKRPMGLLGYHHAPVETRLRPHPLRHHGGVLHGLGPRSGPGSSRFPGQPPLRPGGGRVRVRGQWAIASGIAARTMRACSRDELICILPLGVAINNAMASTSMHVASPRRPLPAKGVRREAQMWAAPGASRSQLVRRVRPRTPRLAWGLRLAAQMWAAPGASQSLQVKHVPVPIARRARPRPPRLA
jgi:hypothetical protein